MKSLSGLGIGLSLVFGCLLLALVAELYYLFWWKKRMINREIEEEDYSSSAREFFYLFCWKQPSSLGSTAMSPQQICNNSVRITSARESGDTQYHLRSNDYILKPHGSGEDGVEAELMRMQSLSGPPRFLFTIKEETKEDLVESEDGKSRSDKSRKGSRSRSLSDLLPKVETPFFTPISSPSLFGTPLTPSNNYYPNELNPTFESSSVVINCVKSSSPPPKFKFLKDAEEKLYRRKLMEEAQKKGAQKLSDSVQGSSSMVRDMEDGLLSQ